MSRRSIFLLAATVVMLYFSIILFMLSPLNGVKSTYYGNNYMNHFGYRQLPQVNWCKELKWRSPPSPNVVALVSYPGSGNTWLRYLLQQATGLLTGSIYMDYGLRGHGFPAENVTDGSVLVVKTHEAPPTSSDKFKSAILLIRNPRDAILFQLSKAVTLLIFASSLARISLADFNRLHKGHIGTAPKYAFKKRSNEHKRSDWASYVSNQLKIWESLNRLWLTSFPGPVHVVYYDVLVQDTRTTLRNMLNFLNHTVTEEDMNCALVNREGIYRRKKKLQDFDPFTSDMYKELERVRQRIYSMVSEYQKRNNITLSHKRRDGDARDEFRCIPFYY